MRCVCKYAPTKPTTHVMKEWIERIITTLAVDATFWLNLRLILGVKPPSPLIDSRLRPTDWYLYAKYYILRLTEISLPSSIFLASTSAIPLLPPLLSTSIPSVTELFVRLALLLVNDPWRRYLKLVFGSLIRRSENCWHPYRHRISYQYILKTEKFHKHL